MSLATAKPPLRIVKCHAPMPGKRLNSTSGKPGLGAALEDHVVVQQRRFEAAAERVALHQRRGVHADLRRVFEPPDQVDAASCVELQRVEVASPHEQDEQRQVAAEVEDVPDVRRHDEVPDQPGIGA